MTVVKGFDKIVVIIIETRLQVLLALPEVVYPAGSK